IPDNGGVRANSRAVPAVLASAHEQSVPIFQQLAGGHPSGRDDVRQIPACLMTFRAAEARRDRCERVAALSTVARVGSGTHGPFEGSRDSWIGPRLFLWPERIPGGEPRMTSRGAE